MKLAQINENKRLKQVWWRVYPKVIQPIISHFEHYAKKDLDGNIRVVTAVNGEPVLTRVGYKKYSPEEAFEKFDDRRERVKGEMNTVLDRALHNAIYGQ